MSTHSFAGQISEVSLNESTGRWQITISSRHSDDDYSVEIVQSAMDMINYNLEKIRGINKNCELLNSTAIIYFMIYATKLEICFSDPTLYCLSFFCYPV